MKSREKENEIINLDEYKNKIIKMQLDRWFLDVAEKLFKESNLGANIKWDEFYPVMNDWFEKTLHSISVADELYTPVEKKIVLPLGTAFLFLNNIQILLSQEVETKKYSKTQIYFLEIFLICMVFAIKTDIDGVRILNFYEEDFWERVSLKKLEKTYFVRFGYKLPFPSHEKIEFFKKKLNPIQLEYIQELLMECHDESEYKKIFCKDIKESKSAFINKMPMTIAPLFFENLSKILEVCKKKPDHFLFHEKVADLLAEGFSKAINNESELNRFIFHCDNISHYKNSSIIIYYRIKAIEEILKINLNAKKQWQKRLTQELARLQNISIEDKFYKIYEIYFLEKDLLRQTNKEFITIIKKKIVEKYISLANIGDDWARINLGNLFMKEGNTEKALSLYLQSAENNCANAYLMIANLISQKKQILLPAYLTMQLLRKIDGYENSLSLQIKNIIGNLKVLLSDSQDIINDKTSIYRKTGLLFFKQIKQKPLQLDATIKHVNAAMDLFLYQATKLAERNNCRNFIADRLLVIVEKNISIIKMICQSPNETWLFNKWIGLIDNIRRELDMDFLWENEDIKSIYSAIFNFIETYMYAKNRDDFQEEVKASQNGLLNQNVMQP